MMDMHEMLQDLMARIARLEAIMMQPAPPTPDNTPAAMPAEPEAPPADVVPQEDTDNN